jgi:hypothetical protein
MSDSKRQDRIIKIAKDLFVSGITVPLESDEKDTVEDGVTSQPLEEGQEEEMQIAAQVMGG